MTQSVDRVDRLAQWIERLPPKVKALGSTPKSVEFFVLMLCLYEWQEEGPQRNRACVLFAFCLRQTGLVQS